MSICWTLLCDTYLKRTYSTKPLLGFITSSIVASVELTVDMSRPGEFLGSIQALVRTSGRDVLAFTLLLALLCTEVGAMCRPRYSPMMVHFEDCIPTRVLAKTCYGQCSSLSDGSNDNNDACCVPRDTIRRRVRLYCPSLENGVWRFVETFKNVTLPKTCHCEACVPNR